MDGQRHDLHSGNFGGAVHNPRRRSARLSPGYTIPTGASPFLDFTIECGDGGPRSGNYMMRNGASDEQILRDAQADRGWGERGYSLYERTTIRPSLSVTGIAGGYQGEGVKAVIPSRATAKINIRLVPNQDPREIERLFRQHIIRITPPTARATVRTFLAARPALLDRHHPTMVAASRAYLHGFGAAPVFLRSGGTIPIVNHFQELLGVPTVLMGFALPDDRIHAPNEKFHLPNFFKGIATCRRFRRGRGRGGKGTIDRQVPCWTWRHPERSMEYEGPARRLPAPRASGRRSKDHSHPRRPQQLC